MPLTSYCMAFIEFGIAQPLAQVLLVQVVDRPRELLATHQVGQVRADVGVAGPVLPDLVAGGARHAVTEVVVQLPTVGLQGALVRHRSRRGLLVDPGLPVAVVIATARARMLTWESPQYSAHWPR
jgi:hypothetical protein